MAQRLAELTQADGRRAPWLLSLVLPHVGGGRMDSGQLAEIEQHPDASALRVSGLDQRTFEALVARYGTQFSALQFWKCPRIADLSPLEDLPQLRLVSFYWNQRATRLWDLSRTPELVGLHFDDFTRLHDLDDLATGASLRELEFGDAVWDTSVFETLQPLAALRNLTALKLSAKRITDGRVEPLGSLTGLRSLSFSARQFTTAQVAWLRARLPDSLHAEALEPLRRMTRPLSRDGRTLDVLLVGKRKPFLNSTTDAARIQRHVEEFERLVAGFRADPALLAD